MDKKIRFTDARILNVNPPENGRSFYYDELQPGLRLQVTATGSKTFQLYTWDTANKKPITHTLGKYPAMLINTARKEAGEILAKIQNGVDITEQKRQKQSELTLEEFFRLWLKTHADVHSSPKYRDETTRLFELHIKQPFGKKKVSEINSDIVQTWHQKLTTKSKLRGGGTLSPATANRCLALIRSIYSKMMPHLTNPAKGVHQYREKSRDRFLRPDELNRFFIAIENEPNKTISDFFMVALFTGARRTNVLSMKWADIDFSLETWTIASDESKNSETLTIPLLPEVLEILSKRKSLTRSIFVFPGKGRTGHLQEPKTGWKRICEKSGLENLRIHDLRRTMGSYQTITGASSTIVGKTLGHKTQQATAIYARLNLDPVRASMEKAVAAMTKDKGNYGQVIDIKEGRK